MSSNEELVEINSKPKLLVIEGGNDLDQDETAFNSELYFSNQIFRSLLDELKEITDRLKLKQDVESQNLFRLGMRLLGMGLNLAQSQLFIKNNEHSRCPISSVYRYIEELTPYFAATEQAETADFLKYLLTNEVVSEIVTNLMVRPGRERSAAVLAIYFGLVEEEEALDLLENFEIEDEDLNQHITSAMHDIEEIAPELQYRGNWRKLLEVE